MTLKGKMVEVESDTVSSESRIVGSVKPCACRGRSKDTAYAAGLKIGGSNQHQTKKGKCNRIIIATLDTPLECSHHHNS